VILRMDSEFPAAKTLPLAIVTGAAIRVGRLIALHLAGNGYAIGLHFHSSRTAAEETAEKIRQVGVPVHLLEGDLTRPEDIEGMFTTVDGLPHRLKLLVNSAALIAPSNLVNMDVEAWDDMMNLNTRAVWLCSREAAKRMTGGGLILNISDVGAGKNWTGYGGYVVSKAAVESLTRVMARQLAPQVRVCAIAPGLLLRSENQPAGDWDRLVEKVPLQRPARASELLQVMDFLIENEYITGEVVSLSGGYQLV